jgi:hypothetical protein
MAYKKPTKDEWRARLKEEFSVSFVNSQMLPVIGSEKLIRRQLQTQFFGQRLLMDSLQSFFLHTLNLTIEVITKQGWPKALPHYTLAFVDFANLFRRFRACELLYNSGYPLDGYALMRDMKDRLFLLGAVAHNRTTFLEVLGVKEGMTITDNDYGDRATDNRKRLQNRITQELTGKSSGLSKEAQDDLKLWESMFHVEVHNGSLTRAQELKALYEKKEMPRFGPSTSGEGYVIYQNRSAEIGWMLVRVLPFLQPFESAFGDDWKKKRDVMDQGFRCLSDDLATAVGKRIGASFIEFMDKKFKFKEPFCYFEATYQYP